MRGYVIERLDGTTDGLGDAVVFETEADAWEAAERAFGGDRASRGPEGVRAWLRVRPGVAVPLRGPWLATAREADPDAWREAVRAALADSGGRRDAAAAALDVPRETLRRWIAEDETLRAGIDLAGPGRPRSERGE